MARRSILQSPELRQSLMALAIGAASGAVTALLMGLVIVALRSLWGEPTEQGLDYAVPLAWSLGVCGSFGVVLSVLHHGDPKTLLPEMETTLKELQHPETAPPRDNFRAVVGAVLALIGGGVSGPEALMTRLAALSSQRLWHGRDHDLQAASVAGSLGIFGAPLLGGALVSQGRRDLLVRWLPGTLGGLAGFACFHGVDEVTGGTLRTWPYAWPTTLREDVGTLSAGLLAAAIGCALGWLLRRWRGQLAKRRLIEHWRWWPVVTGLLLGALMHWLPLVPFAGEDQLRPLLEGINVTPSGILLISGSLKLLMLGLCLETGWRGGILFPVFLISCAFGSAMHQLFPDVGSLGSWCGGVSGAFYMVMLRSRLAVIAVSLSLMQGHGAMGVLVGVVLGDVFNRTLMTDAAESRKSVKATEGL